MKLPAGFTYSDTRVRSLTSEEAGMRMASTHGAQKGHVVLEKFGGRLVRCWVEHSSHNSEAAANTAEKKLRKALGLV